MEAVWHGQFDRLFNTFPHQWLLQPVAAADTEQLNTGEYAVFQDSAKVRFFCKVTSFSCIIGAWLYTNITNISAAVLWAIVKNSIPL